MVAHLSPQHFRDSEQPDQFILGYLASLRLAWDIKQTRLGLVMHSALSKQRQEDLSLRPAWATEWVPGQSMLFQTKQNKQAKKTPHQH